MPFKKIARLFLGIALTLIGIVGLILPIMPGWIFLIPGLVILGDYFPPIRRLVTWAKRKAGIAEDPCATDVQRDAGVSQTE